MKKSGCRLVVLALVLALAAQLPLCAAGTEQALHRFSLGIKQQVFSDGRYANWAGVSSVSQFSDEKGNFCFAYCDESTVTIVKTASGSVADTIRVKKLYPLLGSAVCDKAGNIYLIWGSPNEGDDTAAQTIFVSKYTGSGSLVATVGGNGSEGLESYYNSSFYTRVPFDGGNCDTAIYGDTLLVNYARHMYSGHQSNGIFAVNIASMTVREGFKNYNSHSFDQRVTPYAATGGFLLTSQGDCFPRSLSTSVTNSDKVTNTFESFHFWVYPDAYRNYNMYQLNPTYMRLGNVLDTGKGAAIVGASARALSEEAPNQPYDLFVQVFDPTGSAQKADSYLTAGTRSGLGGNNGDMQVTDYGVQWLTNLAGSDKTIDVVQAVTTDTGNIVVLYETTEAYNEKATCYLVLDPAGKLLQETRSLGSVALNTDEDPVFSHGAVEWVSNNEQSRSAYRWEDASDSSDLMLNILDVSAWSKEGLSLSGSAADPAGTVGGFADVKATDYFAGAVQWAVDKGITKGTSRTAFSPNKLCTEAQVVTFLYRAAGEPALEGDENPLGLDRSLYYYNAATWLCTRGYMQDSRTGERIPFRPDAPCTRALAVYYQWRCSNGSATRPSGFSDVSADAYYADAVSWAAEANITTGTGNGFSPEQTCTRAQIVTFLNRGFAK